MPRNRPQDQQRVPAALPRGRDSHHRAPAAIPPPGGDRRSALCRDGCVKRVRCDYWLWRIGFCGEDEAVATGGVLGREDLLLRWAVDPGPPRPQGFSISAFHANSGSGLAAAALPQGLQLGKG